jgi:hypothetical protein
MTNVLIQHGASEVHAHEDGALVSADFRAYQSFRRRPESRLLLQEETCRRIRGIYDEEIETVQ